MARVIMVVSRVADLPLRLVPRGMRASRQVATCEICGERVQFRRENYATVRSQGNTPILVCVTCFQDGSYRKQAG